MGYRKRIKLQQPSRAASSRQNVSSMAKDDKLYIRVSADIKKQLQTLANKEKRTLSDYVALILEREIEKENKISGSKNL